MENELPIVYIARHGETAWSLSGQHTGLTDLPLTEFGEQNTRKLGQRLKGLFLPKVLTSPLQRARRTCEVAGYGAAAASTSVPNVRAGTCSEMVVQKAKLRSRSVLGRTELLAECG